MTLAVLHQRLATAFFRRGWLLPALLPLTELGGRGLYNTLVALYGIWGLSGLWSRRQRLDKAVSYTHLDVYKRQVEDKPGVLAEITRILADQQISIDAMIQREPDEGEDQTDIIMLTHQTREKNIDAAVEKIEALPVVKCKLTRLRLEALL